jgi:hypothetical protein
MDAFQNRPGLGQIPDALITLPWLAEPGSPSRTIGLCDKLDGGSIRIEVVYCSSQAYLQAAARGSGGPFQGLECNGLVGGVKQPCEGGAAGIHPA